MTTAEQNTAITLFNAGMPAHLADLNEQGNIVARDQTSQLSFRGKVWRVVVDGKEDPIKDKEGDPVPAVNVIVLAYNPRRSRAYFSGGYEEGKSSMPACWSADGVTPDKEVPAEARQHSACASCPQAAKGAKVTDAGKAVAACGQFKRAVVVPSADPGFEPLLLKIPQTSMWDGDNKENEAKGFFAFDQYMDFVKGKGINNTALLITKMKFDARTSYPKLLFGAANWTPEEKKPAVLKHLSEHKEVIDRMLSGKMDFVPAAAAPATEEFEQAGDSPAAEAAAKEAAAATAAAAAAAKTTKAATPAPAAPPRPARAPKAAAAPAAAAPAPEPVKQAEPATIDNDTGAVETVPAAAAGALKGLVSSWDDEQ